MGEFGEKRSRGVLFVWGDAVYFVWSEAVNRPFLFFTWRIGNVCFFFPFQTAGHTPANQLSAAAPTPGRLIWQLSAVHIQKQFSIISARR